MTPYGGNGRRVGGFDAFGRYVDKQNENRHVQDTEAESSGNRQMERRNR